MAFSSYPKTRSFIPPHPTGKLSVEIYGTPSRTAPFAAAVRAPAPLPAHSQHPAAPSKTRSGGIPAPDPIDCRTFRPQRQYVAPTWTPPYPHPFGAAGSIPPCPNTLRACSHRPNRTRCPPLHPAPDGFSLRFEPLRLPQTVLSKTLVPTDSAPHSHTLLHESNLHTRPFAASHPETPHPPFASTPHPETAHSADFPPRSPLPEPDLPPDRFLHGHTLPPPHIWKQPTLPISRLAPRFRSLTFRPTDFSTDTHFGFRPASPVSVRFRLPFSPRPEAGSNRNPALWRRRDRHRTTIRPRFPSSQCGTRHSEAAENAITYISTL